MFDTDKHLKIFCSRVKEDVFQAITHQNQVWQSDPYDVENIHQESRDCFQRLLNRINVLESSDSGRIMLLLGESGAGKTHLMRAFRNFTHEKALGYFAYMQMTSSFSNYSSYALRYTIDSLDKPYHESNGSVTGLMRLSTALIEEQNVVSQNDIDRLRNSALNRSELTDLIHKIADDILNKKSERFKGVDLDLIRVLLYLQSEDPATHFRVSKYLRCEDLSEYDRKILGDMKPRLQEEDPQRLLQALAHLIMATDSGSLIICLDQLEDIYPADEAEVKFRRTMETMIKLAQLPNVIVVIACLNDIYTLLRNSLPSPQLDRIEHDPDTIYLKAGRDEAEIRNLITIRLQDLYQSKHIDLKDNEPLYPFRNETPSRLAQMSTRQVLDWCRQQRELSIQTSQIPSFPDIEIPVGDDTPSSSQPPILQFNQLWNDYLVDSHSAPETDGAMLQLLNRSITHCNAELNNTFKFRAMQQSDYLNIDIQNVAGDTEQQLTIGLCQKAPQGGALARQIDQLQIIAGTRIAIALRSAEFPSDPKTKIAVRLGEFVAMGGKRVIVSDSDWRAMVAMESFRKQYEQQPQFLHWLQTERPLLGLPSFQHILDIKVFDTKTINKPLSPEEITSAIDAGTDTIPIQPLTDGTQLVIGINQDYQQYPYVMTVEKLVRHAAFLGGSGSGKTTLALNIIEQLLLQGIPAILLDRKGDLCSYALEEAWRNPIVDSKRKQMRNALHDRIEVMVYTPGAVGGQGRPLGIPVAPNGLGNLSTGECLQLANHAAFSLGKILGYKEQSRQDKQKIAVLGQAISVLSKLNPDEPLAFDHLMDFIDKKDPVLLNAIGKLDTKLFNRLVEDLQTLSLTNGNLFAQSGELLSTENLFGLSSNNKTKTNSTRLSIISTASLGSNDNILFWVSQLLLEIGRFAAKSPSDKLQGVIFFDEADLYLPAQSKPATKEPLESLLRRARSAGIGLMLATQSPGDMDYKSRDQISSWFLGRIKEKTALDKLRPVFNDSREDIASKLPIQSTGEFYAIHNGEIRSIKANTSLVQAKQVPMDEIMKLASKKPENRISTFFQNLFPTK
ncbi:AAA family ATPase [Nitrosomonas aestuarii]|uniref:AAA family ATPase n=1 Tax=Nitrosomonas aestuarii TaxID=52441 RepID=UPI000D3038A0|nr:AAA family ATPase [Nitrosomonas aestuarii]PTN12281.1 uncharacterized protein DUF853 [Nitrosomonas aestuarii]